MQSFSRVLATVAFIATVAFLAEQQTLLAQEASIEIRRMGERVPVTVTGNHYRVSSSFGEGAYQFRVTGSLPGEASQIWLESKYLNPNLYTTIPMAVQADSWGTFILEDLTGPRTDFAFLVGWCTGGFAEAEPNCTVDASITWASPPRVEVATPELGECVTQVCAREGRDLILSILGDDREAIAVGGEVVVRSLPDSLELGRGRVVSRNGTLFSTVPHSVSAGTGTLDWLIDLPLDPEVAPLMDADDSPMTSMAVEVTASVLRPLPRPMIELLEPGEVPSDVFIVDGNPYPVMIRCRCSNGGTLDLESDTDYRLTFPGARTDDLSYGLLTTGSAGGGDSIEATLRVVRPTPYNARPDVRPLLDVVGDDGLPKHGVRLAFIPPPRIEEIRVERTESGRSADRVLYAGERDVRFWIRGSGLIRHKQLSLVGLGGQVVEVHPVPQLPGWMRSDLYNVPWRISGSEFLALDDGLGNPLSEVFTVHAAQTPADLRFVTLMLRDHPPIGFGSKSAVLGSGGQDVATQGVPSLRGASLLLEPGRIEQERDVLNGVQYIDVTLSLHAPDGEELESETRCYALVPPRRNAIPYRLDAGCTAVLHRRSIPLHSILGGTIERSVAQASLQVDVRHRQEKYPNHRGRARSVTLRQEGGISWDLRGSLSALLRLSGGPPGTDNQQEGGGGGGPDDLGIQPTGAILEVTPFSSNRSIRLQTGVVLTSLFRRDGEVLSNLATPLSASWRLENMRGSFAFEFSLGYLFPWYGGFFDERALVISPGVSFSLSEG